MFYYAVWVGDRRYQGHEALAYQSEDKLAIGTLVSVPLRGRLSPAVVIEEVAQPSFNCQNVVNVPDLPVLPIKLIELLNWLKQYYPVPIGPLTQLCLPSKLPRSAEINPAVTQIKITSPPLNTEQREAVQIMSQPGSYLLHGRTGSGKTHVYAALAQNVLKAGRSVIILNPEIGLTTQLTKKIKKLVGIEPVVLHSQLTEKQRRDNWLKLLSAKSPQLVIGARSALFAPLDNIGLIVVDESHESAYRQDSQPRYLATRVAANLAKLHSATLILGSATPSLVDYFLAEQKKRPIIKLDKLAQTTTENVNLKVVDLKDRSQFSRSSYLSDDLIEAVESSLKNSEQVMLYLNRRGTARLSLCVTCGWRATCPHCDLPLVYHGDQHRLICHTCGHKQTAKNSCPECGSQDIAFKAAGTKAIEAEAKRLFSRAKTGRFDTDNIKSDRLEQNYDAIASGEIDIIVGTQLIAKGLDLPKLTTLGVVLADSSLAIPDFGSAERTYQLIRQVIGRVGRGHQQNANVIIQTYNPANRTILSAVSEQDQWQNFYTNELTERKNFNFPPYYHLAKLSCKRASANSAEKACRELAAKLTSNLPSLVIEGPAPAFHEKTGKDYCWQLVLKSKKRADLIKAGQMARGSWVFDLDPINLL